MEYKVTPHKSPVAYHNLATHWLQVIRRNESGTWIFPPLAGVSYLVQQFIEDRSNIAKEQFGDENALCVVECALSNRHYSKNDLHEELQQAITAQVRLAWLPGSNDLGVLLKMLWSGRKKIVLFIYGLDTAIRSGNTEVLELLNQLANGNRFVSVILLLCTDVTDPQFAAAFGTNTALIQNISIVPRKSPEEGRSFLKYLEKSWDVQLSKDQRRWAEDNLDNSLRFTKEVFRQVQKNPQLTYEGLYTNSSLEYKSLALLDNFLDDQREVILKIVFKEPLGRELAHALRYLKTIRWVEDDGQLRLSMQLFDHYIRNHEQQPAAYNPTPLTVKEEAAFTALKERLGSVVSRELLADAIWGDESAEKYSDWAIDQLIHRLKVKLMIFDQSYTVRTVRGRGFVLQASK